ncbi:hypothetical protein WN944_003238 [Citrus x changshan-huyou]|uniref:FANCI solenoid 2 domain-containing protein n=1 Tax=Citrus x changshan-huyou TaxID=2935761 RepID=A0AAP0M193_9ROSI
MPSLVTTVINFTAQEDDKKKQNELGLLEITCPATAAGFLYFPMLYISVLGTISQSKNLTSRTSKSVHMAYDLYATSSYHLEEGSLKEHCYSNGLVGIEEVGNQILIWLGVKLIGTLVQNYPYPMLEHVSRPKELLDYFTFMHGEVATYLVTAFSHVLCFSSVMEYLTLKNHCFI